MPRYNQSINQSLNRPSQPHPNQFMVTKQTFKRCSREFFPTERQNLKPIRPCPLPTQLGGSIERKKDRLHSPLPKCGWSSRSVERANLPYLAHLRGGGSQCLPPLGGGSFLLRVFEHVPHREDRYPTHRLLLQRHPQGQH